MADISHLKATPRTGTVNHIRHRGGIPGVVYGHGIQNEQIQVESRAFEKVLSQTGLTTLLKLSVEDRDHNVIIREVQYHPVSGLPLHIDFYQVRMDEKVRAEVPLHLVGEAPAVKDLGGVMVRNIDELDIEALPADLPHDIAVDITQLKTFDDVIHVSDLKLPKGVTAFNDPADVVALVQPPRTEEELASLAEEVSEDVEAVEGIKKEEPAPDAEGEEPTKDAEAKNTEAQKE